MPRYTVILTRDITESTSVEVEAADEDEAQAKAMDMDTEGRFDWTVDENAPQRAYTNGADLILPPEPTPGHVQPGEAMCQECLRPTTIAARVFVQHGPGKDGALICVGSGQRPTVRL